MVGGVDAMTRAGRLISAAEGRFSTSRSPVKKVSISDLQDTNILSGTYITRRRGHRHRISRLGVTEALRNGDELVTFSFEGLQSVRQNLLGARLVRFVVQSQDVLRLLVGDGLVRVLDLLDGSGGGVARVEVPDDDLLAVGGGDFAGSFVVAAVGRANVVGFDAEDLLESRVGLGHFLLDCRRRK